MKKTFKHFFCLFVAILCFGEVWATEYSGTVTFYTTGSALTKSSITNSNASVTFSYSDLSASSETKICNVASRYGIKGKNKKLITVTCPDGYYFKSAQFTLASFGGSETPTAQILSGSTSLYTCTAHKYTKIDASDCGDTFSCEDSITSFVASEYTTLTVKEVGNSKNLGVTYLAYTIAPTSGGGSGGGEEPKPATTYSVTHTLSNITATSGTTGASAATEGSAYNAVFKSGKVGYTLPSTISVTIGGAAATSGTDYTWDASTGAFQVPAAKVTGNIVVTIAGVAPTKTFKSTYTDFTRVDETNLYYTLLTQTDYNSYAAAGWLAYEGESVSSKKFLIDPADDSTISGTNNSYGTVKNEGSKYMEFCLTGITAVKFYFHHGGSGDPRIAKYKLNGGDETTLVSVSAGTSDAGTINLDPSVNNTIHIYATGDLCVCAMKVTLPVAPTITNPTSTPDAAVYTVGDETTALSVTATGTPTPTYQWYSNTTASTTKATTLTNCTTATYTPSSADVSDLYYYCVATNVAGSATSVFFHVKVNAPALPTHSITYDNLKGQSVSSYPTEYYETVGVASFDPLADVAGFHFTGWSPASIATTATTDQTITAQWTPTYSVTYNLNGATSGTLPTETAKYEDQEFTLAAQGDIVAPTDKKFLGWKDQDGNKYDAEANYTMPGKAVTLTAYWALKMEDVIYSWEGGSEGATEVGGTATHYNGDEAVSGNTRVNYAIEANAVTYYTISLNGKTDYSDNHIRFALDENVKAGDKVKMTAFYTKDSNKDAAGKMNTQSGTVIFEGEKLPNIYSGGSPVLQTYTVPEGINTNAVKMTRHQTGSGTFITKLEIIRESYIDEDDLLTVTFNSNGGSSVASQKLQSGQTATEPEDPTWAHHRFNQWQLGGSAYDFSTAVTANITLDATWTQLYTITYANGGGSGTAPAAVDDKAKDETFTVAENTFTAPTGKEFDKWSDGTNYYKAGDTYTVGTANVTLTAQWRTPVQKYTITYNLGGASGDAPTEEDQAAGDGFFLASAPSRDGYVFRGWQCDIDDVLYAAGASYTMTAAATTFTAVWKRDAYTLFHWRANETTTKDAANGTTTGGTTTLRTNNDSKSWGTENATYASSVAADMKSTTTKELKAGSSALYLELELTEGSFLAGDTVYVTGYNPWGLTSDEANISKGTFDVVSSITTGSGSGSVNTGYGIIADNVNLSKVYVHRVEGSSSGIAAIKIIRPRVRIVTDTEIALYAVSINDAAISASNLSTLVSAHELDLSNAYINAPTVKFIERTTVTYDEGDPKITDREISATASENLAGKWEATASIDNIDYTVTLAIPTDPKLETETTTLTLASEMNRSDSKTFTFSGMNLEHNVTIGLASPIEGITISPTEVTPNSDGAITDEEITITYASMVDVAATNVVLTVYYSESVKKEITLTYSSTKGYTAITDVTGDITWDFSKTGSTSLQNQTDVILANMPGVTNDENFNSETLFGTFNKLKGDGNSYQGSVLKFHTTVPGEVTVNFSGTNSNTRKLQVVDNTGTVAEWTYNSSSEKLTKTIAVQPGDVYLRAFEGETHNNARIYWLKFELKYPEVVLDADADEDDLVEYADVTISSNANLTLSNAHNIHDLKVENGGKVTLDGGSLNVAGEFSIQTMTGASSGQLIGTNVAAASLSIEIKLKNGDMDAEASRDWYCISAPFDVALNGGFFWGDGTPMVYNTDFQLFEYDGEKRAGSGNGWKRVGGNKMNANKAHFIGFDDERSNQNTIRLKAMSTVIPTATSIALGTYPGDEANANWNGVANPTLHYVGLDKSVSLFDVEKQIFNAYAYDDYSFVVGAPLFVQSTGSISLSDADYGQYYAPQRSYENDYSYCVRISKPEATRFDNQMYVRASENATNSFEQDHDMASLNGTTSSRAALVWTENYNMRLAIQEAPLYNNTASYELGLSAPAAGEYVLSVTDEVANTSLYLTYNGSIMWDLSASPFTITLNQGVNYGYGLLMQVNAPHVATGVDNAEDNLNVKKIILNEHVYILRDGQLFDITGKIAK